MDDLPLSIPTRIVVVGLGKKKTNQAHSLIEQTQTHVVIGIFRLGFLLLLLLGGSWGSSGGGGWGSGSRCGTGSRSNVGDQVLDVDSLQSLGEQTRPVRLNIDVGGLKDGRDLLTLKTQQQQ